MRQLGASMILLLIMLAILGGTFFILNALCHILAPGTSIFTL